MNSIPPRERTAILQSLSAGVVPAIGLHHIQVGRKDEVAAIVNDLQLVEQGSATIRFVIGRYGSGKTFFLHLMRSVALQRKFVVLQADITTDRRLYGTGGEARALYTELMRSLATRARPEGGALPNLIERWVGEVEHELRSSGGTDEDVRRGLQERLRPVQELVAGFDFANVVAKYYEAYLAHNQDLQDQALRWLRGEFSTKTEAREALGVRSIIDDASAYDYLKLWARFVRIAGYRGLLVSIDELVVLSHRLANTLSRNKNYEAILRILNDCLQGQTQGLAFLFAGTDDCLEDPRRGIFSYEALATRLAANRFAAADRRDWTSPVIRLQNLSPEDCFVLLCNIRHVHAGGEAGKASLPDDAIVEYLRHCSQRMGAAYFQTPRDTVKDFVSLLQILEQNPGTDWKSLVVTQQAALASRDAAAPLSSALDEFTL